MKTALQIIVAVVCIVDAFLATFGGLTMLISPETARRELGENDPSVTAGMIALLMAVLLLATTFFVFRVPQKAVLALAIVMALQVVYVFVLNVGGPQLVLTSVVPLGLSLLVRKMSTDKTDIAFSDSNARPSNPPSSHASAHRRAFCTQCGEPVLPESRFCGACGTSLT